MRRIVQMSGGAGSWAAAKRTVERHGTADVVLLFADTLIEDNDAYRLLLEGGCNVMGVHAPADLLATIDAMPEAHEDLASRRSTLLEIRTNATARYPWLRWIADGRTPWDVFRDVRLLGNSRIDPCSRLLKRELIAGWLAANAEPERDVCVVGIDWSEAHRFDRIEARWQQHGGWRYEAPMIEKPHLTKWGVLRWMRGEGLRVPKLYGWGLSHNNCGGGCVKAGIGHFVRLREVAPERYAWWQAQEEAMRDYLGKDVAMLKDRQGGESRPLTLRALAESVDADDVGQLDLFDMGGCGCSLPDAA